MRRSSLLLEEEKPSVKEGSVKERLWRIVFEAETPKGKAFDIALLWVIALSVMAVILESVPSFKARWAHELSIFEWGVTVFFTLEYLLRIWLVRRPLRYMFSFFGVVDLLSCIPTYLAIFFAGAQSLLIIRILRLLRIFRILKMIQHVRGANLIVRSLLESRAKISVFFFTMFVFSVIIGTLLYFLESSAEATKFTNIPISIYYTIITITTIGFGDITPQTSLGMLITAATGLLGYAVIAVPTGLITAGIMKEASYRNETTEACPGCGVHGHLLDASFCRRCGEKLEKNQERANTSAS